MGCSDPPSVFSRGGSLLLLFMLTRAILMPALFQRHCTVIYTQDWKEDALRRDLTINAGEERSDRSITHYTLHFTHYTLHAAHCTRHPTHCTHSEPLCMTTAPFYTITDTRSMLMTSLRSKAMSMDLEGNLYVRITETTSNREFARGQRWIASSQGSLRGLSGVSQGDGATHR